MIPIDHTEALQGNTWRKRFVSAASILLAACSLSAANPGDEVIVIYNTKVPESKAVAEYYAQRRNVPANQLFGFSLSTGDEMSRSEFQDSLQKPLAKQLSDKKLWRITSSIVSATTNYPAHVQWRPYESKIRYAVICYGVPFRIAADNSLVDKNDNKKPEFRRNEAAVDNDLALLPAIEEHPPLPGILNNPLYGATNPAAFYPSNGVLLVTRLDGPSAAIARGLVDKAMEAETNGLWGRAYFDLRNISEPTYKVGDEWIRGAADVCKHLGLETVVDDNPATFPPEFPMSQIAWYCGWYDGDVSGPFARPNVEFMPGAFAYHLHSYSAANLRSATRNWVGPLLAKGATIAMGSVDEPYLTGTPDLTVFTARMLYFGLTFGESAYASQAFISWQTTAVGDPLYRAAQPAQQLHESLDARHSKLIEWSHLRLVNLNLIKGAPMIQMAAYLEKLELTKESAVLTEKLANLYSAQGKPSSAVEYWERALKLDPSPLQRVRLRLALADKLATQNRDQEVVENLGKLLQENPDYPAKLGIYQRLAALAHKLGKPEAAASYEDHIRELDPARTNHSK